MGKDSMRRKLDGKLGIKKEHIGAGLISPREFDISMDIQGIPGFKGIPHEDGIYFRWGKGPGDIMLLARQPERQQPAYLKVLVPNDELKQILAGEDIRPRLENIARNFEIKIIYHGEQPGQRDKRGYQPKSS